MYVLWEENMNPCDPHMWVSNKITSWVTGFKNRRKAGRQAGRRADIQQALPLQGAETAWRGDLDYVNDTGRELLSIPNHCVVLLFKLFSMNTHTPELGKKTKIKLIKNGEINYSSLRVTCNLSLVSWVSSVPSLWLDFVRKLGKERPTAKPEENKCHSLKILEQLV